ncbi:DNA-binding transcriptional MerR regulator [Nocardiopsis mwathae]|uniref:DNA-binding transcriptional MerR regulator n=1 Tax=Nocardiopsis mwathae TaxID=1472723 RepID=A0A7W9YG96_9ACTN|nr:DNA-binding transcriptional MerR regulator [Nocardiopsis mwathae]
METQHGLHTIGALAERSGLPVKTIRFYSDQGIVPPTGRSAAGYRLYDAGAVARLDLVRTLRDLGIDLATIRAVLDREVDIGAVAAAHADALDAQIRVLRVRRAVLRTVAHRTPEEREITLMNRLARLSAEERQRIIDGYHEAVFGGLEGGEAVEAKFRAVSPALPDDPTPEQVDAWVELAELVQDPGFRQRSRQMAEEGARARAEGAPDHPSPARQDLADQVTAAGRAALAAGTSPDAAEGQAVVEELMPSILAAYGGTDTPARRAEIAEEMSVFSDARVERYWRLLGVINGMPPFEPRVPAWEWLIAALRATGPR